MIGLEQTEVMAERWQAENIISITFLSSSLLPKGSSVSMTMLSMLRGAQDRKKMTLTVIRIVLIFFLRTICRDRRCEERLWLVWPVRH